MFVSSPYILRFLHVRSLQYVMTKMVTMVMMVWLADLCDMLHQSSWICLVHPDLLAPHQAGKQHAGGKKIWVLNWEFSLG
jgi:hypothetical protein